MTEAARYPFTTIDKTETSGYKFSMSNAQEEKSGARAWINEELFKKTDPKNAMKEWAGEATKFVQRNPWVAVAAAAAIGYYLGSMGPRRRAEKGEAR